jgi:hypothetical protein
VASNAKMPGTGVPVSERTEMHGMEAGPLDSDGHLVVAELVSDRPAAPSPFGDDQTFPLPVDRLTYTPTTTP